MKRTVMDESVIRTMARWPDVPAVFGYLALSRRGQWLVCGDPVTHERTREFINRNYDHDDRGRWFFRNGPQQVYIHLEYTPWIYRLDNDAVVTHTGRDAGQVMGGWMDDHGALLLETAVGIGLVHDRDLAATQSLVRSRNNSDDEPDDPEDTGLRLNLRGAVIPIRLLRRADVPVRFGFDPAPAPRPEERLHAGN